MLVLSGAPTQRWHLIDFAQAISHQQALLSVVTIVTDKSLTPQRLESLEQTNNDYLEKRGVDAFSRVFKAEDPFVGTERFIAAYGIGPLVPNTVLLGDSEQTELRASYSQMLVNLHALGRNIVIIKDNSEQSFGFRRRIDVWWGGLKGNGGLMLTLAYLLTTSPAWEDAVIHVNVVVADESAAESTQDNLEQVVTNSRIGATTHVIVAYGQPFEDILKAHSQASDLILLGMRAPKDEDTTQETAERYEDYASYYERLRNYADGLPTTAFVLAAEDIDFGDILA